MAEPDRTTRPLERWHARLVDELASALKADIDMGLAAREVERRRARSGWNELPEATPVSWLTILLSQFTGIIIWVLIAAAVVSGLLEDWLDTAAILAIVVLNGLLGFVQEFRAERSLAALRKLSVATSRAIRDGALQTIPARDLVPGDVIQIEAGDRIPADGRLIYTTANFQVQEASLTGESTAVPKDWCWLGLSDVPVADRRNMTFLGTTAVSGKARALVVATGMKTELGRISSMIQEAESAERRETPLQRRLDQFGYTLLWLALAVVTVVFALGYIRGVPLVEMFLTSVSLAVAAVPEGLPAVVTITLALGVTRMVKRHALIRNLPAVETLGSSTVICTDKTGTLTKNELTVTRLVMDGRLFEVTGEGYEPTGDIREARPETRVLSPEWSDPKGVSSREHSAPSTQHSALPAGLRHLLKAGLLCNGAALAKEDDTWRIIGDPTDGALLVVAAKAGLAKEDLERAAPFHAEIPFDSERKMMSVIRQRDRDRIVFAKGAPDVLLALCAARMTLEGSIEPMDEQGRRAVLDANALLAHEALRILAAAYKPLDHGDAGSPDLIERDLIFLGLFAMKDPLRPEATEAVRLCREAGITTVMITGDHKETASAIARELGLADAPNRVLSGPELDALSDEELSGRVERLSVYARVSAEHKLRIVKAWKSRGAVVAMTGDGVNDAPAIKAADIGIAMGITGTDVTKDAADMVVIDDNFASITAAVEEGRGVFDNIRKTVHFLLSCNMSEVLVMLFAALLGLPLPLLPIQILWMNLVTDGLPALALAVDPKAPDLMCRPPRKPAARLLDSTRLAAVAGEGLLLAIVALGAFTYSLFVWRQPIEQARTVAFAVMVGAQLVHTFNCRSYRWSLFQIGVATNRPLIWAFLVSLGVQVAILTVPAAQPIFKVAPLPFEDWKLMVAMAFLPLAAVEAIKLARRHPSFGFR
ncbi:MAG: calcium-transporting P-type ATPase, PMR1-type [Nitrospira sp.]